MLETYLETYDELLEGQKRVARKRHPEDYKEWYYKMAGYDIEFSCQ